MKSRVGLGYVCGLAMLSSTGLEKKFFILRVPCHRDDAISLFHTHSLKKQSLILSSRFNVPAAHQRPGRSPPEQHFGQRLVVSKSGHIVNHIRILGGLGNRVISGGQIPKRALVHCVD